MAISFIRVDDRMIHGQTCTRWALEYPCDGLIAVNNAAAKNPVLKSAYKSASGKKTLVWSLEEFKEKSEKVLKSKDNYFLITKNPLDMETILVEQGLKPGISTVIIGPCNDRPGTTKLGNNQSITQEEAQALVTGSASWSVCVSGKYARYGRFIGWQLHIRKTLNWRIYMRFDSGGHDYRNPGGMCHAGGLHCTGHSRRHRVSRCTGGQLHRDSSGYGCIEKLWTGSYLSRRGGAGYFFWRHGRHPGNRIVLRDSHYQSGMAAYGLAGCGKKGLSQIIYD